jgi:hypothetical protein
MDRHALVLPLERFIDREGVQEEGGTNVGYTSSYDGIDVRC